MKGLALELAARFQPIHIILLGHMHKPVQGISVPVHILAGTVQIRHQGLYAQVVLDFLPIIQQPVQLPRSFT
ncbi:hypothetical protein D3C71_1811830 [compost metagenome]